MTKVGVFDRVSFGEFCKAMKSEFYEKLCRFASSGVKDEDSFLEYAARVYNGITLPSRATKGSAGYDFKAPFSFELYHGMSIKIPTGIRAKIDDGWWLSIVPRSSLGFKYSVVLANTVGVVDGDYYYSDNEGHIFIKLVNQGEKTVKVSAGDHFAQGIFLPYGITYGDNTEATRNGGIGSTGK